MSREITYAEAIREAIDQGMQADDSVFIIGEGVPDPKFIFGTTKDLQSKYGSDRVMDMPVAENGLTGICIGAAITGLKPIIVHQRLDFAYLCLDQLANNAAKWHYMFDGKMNVPFIMRTIIGRGWGQGAQHSQNIHALFAHIPGLKVIMPSTAYDAKGLLLSALKDGNPIVWIEHRWLHNIKGVVPQEPYTVPIGNANIVKEGSDLTVVANSFMTVESLKAINALPDVSIELIDLRTIKPLDIETILTSVKKTGKLLVVDSGYYTGGIAGDIIAKVTEKAFSDLKKAPMRVTLPDIPTPSTPALTKYYYPRHVDIIQKIGSLIDMESAVLSDLIEREKSKLPEKLDIPDPSFTGPF